MALAAFLIGYFVYQVAYGFIMPQNGSVTITNPNGMWATFKAPPGNVVTIRPEGPPVNLTTNAPVAPPVILANDTWTIVNSTSGSVGTIKFHQVWHNVDSETVVYIYTFDRLPNGRHLTGAYSELKGSDGWQGNCQLILCYNQQYVPNFLWQPSTGCAILNSTMVSPNH